MADKKISELDALVATELAASGVLPVVSGGATKKLRADALRAALDGLRDYGAIGSTRPVIDIDAEDLSLFDLETCARFSGDGSHLSVAAWSGIDFSTADTFSVFGFRNPLFHFITGTNGLDHCLVSHSTWGTANGQKSWEIASGGSTGQGNSLRFIIWTSSTSDTIASAVTPKVGLDDVGNNYSSFCATYDGGEATAADRPKLYQDGVLVDPGSYVTSGTMPADVLASTAPLRIGAAGGTAPHLNTGLMKMVVIFNRVLDAEEVAFLDNGGRGWKYKDFAIAAAAGDFDATGLVAWYELDEEYGTRFNMVGTANTHLAESGGAGTVPSAKVVVAMRDRQGRLYEPRGRLRHATSTLLDYGRFSWCAAPRWIADGLGGRPCLRKSPQHVLHCDAPSPFAATTCDALLVHHIHTFNTLESFLLFTGGLMDETTYYGFGTVPISSDRRGWVRIRSVASGLNTQVNGATNYATGTDYVDCWRVKGSGDAASYEHRLNGAADTPLSYGTGAQNSTPRGIAPRHNITFGGLSRSNGINVATHDQSMARMLVFAPALADDEFAAIETALRARYDV